LNDDEKWMDLALSLAKSGAALGEVPVGAVIVKNGQVIATGFNRREFDRMGTHHAEIIAIEEACTRLCAWRLIDCTLYVTLEPCVMCAGAIVQARIPRVVFGTTDPKGGAFGSLYSIHDDKRLNHTVACWAGVRGLESSEILKTFFRRRRAENAGEFSNE
jgi:tRNA(adenine34) deaminase